MGTPNPVYIRSAELGAPFTDKPEIPLRKAMEQAARKAIASAGLEADDIDALFVAAMGSFEHEQFMGTLPLRIANQLSLRADVAPMMIGSSETGAWALRSAFQALRRDDHQDHVLIIAGEQMNPLVTERATSPEARLAERLHRNRTISQVVDESDRRYSLNMLRMSDLIMDQIAHMDDWTVDDLSNLVLPFIALEKYRRVRRYPYGQFFDNQLETIEQYQTRPRITHYFRLDDVTPTSTGVVALILSRDPQGSRRPVEIIGMGQGYVPASLSARRGDPAVTSSIRDAYDRACEDAGVDSSWLLNCDFAVIHDAFPSIEYSFLKELELGPASIVERLVSGWSNPFGGLKGCGHALGASGLLQVAKSFQAFTADPHYVLERQTPSPYPEFVVEPPYNTAFTTSVGGVLTNILVTLLRARDDNGWERSSSAVIDAILRGQKPTEKPAEETSPARSTGLRILARTRLKHTPSFGDDLVPLTAHVPDPWVYLLDRPDQPAAEKPLAFGHQLWDIGQIVTVAHRNFDGVDYLEVVEPVADAPRHPYVKRSMDEDRIHHLVELEKRFQECGHRRDKVVFCEPRTEGSYLVYAAQQHDKRWQALRARVLDPDCGRPLGHPVGIHQLDVSGERAEHLRSAWLERSRIAHPALAAILEVTLNEDRLQIVADLHQGVTLAEWLERKPCERTQALRWSRRLASALAALHEMDHIHGHISAETVVISAREHSFLQESPHGGMGTRANDLEGLGVVMFSMLDGTVPANAAEARHQLSVVTRTRATAAVGFEALIGRCLRVVGTNPLKDAATLVDELVALEPHA